MLRGNAAPASVGYGAGFAISTPGDYMLFLVDSGGVPSVGRFVRIS